MSLVDKQAVLPSLGEQQHLVEEEGMPGRLGAAHPEASLGDELAIGGEIGTVPTVQKRLNLLDANRMLVLALHLVYVLGDAIHRLKGRVDCRLAFLVLPHAATRFWIDVAEPLR